MEIDATQVLDLSIEEDSEDKVCTERRAVAKLKVYPRKGFDECEFTIYEGINIIGRDDRANIAIKIQAVSKKHACIEVTGESHLLYDYDSRNKTRLGKLVLQPLVRYNLTGNDEIIFGDVRCLYVIQQEQGGNEHDDTCSLSGSETGSESMLPVDHDVSPISPLRVAAHVAEQGSPDSLEDSDLVLMPTQHFSPQSKFNVNRKPSEAPISGSSPAAAGPYASETDSEPEDRDAIYEQKISETPGFPRRGRSDHVQQLPAVEESDSECSFDLSLQLASTVPVAPDGVRESFALADRVEQFAATLPVNESGGQEGIQGRLCSPEAMLLSTVPGGALLLPAVSSANVASAKVSDGVGFGYDADGESDAELDSTVSKSDAPSDGEERRSLVPVPSADSPIAAKNELPGGSDHLFQSQEIPFSSGFSQTPRRGFKASTYLLSSPGVSFGTPASSISPQSLGNSLTKSSNVKEETPIELLEKEKQIVHDSQGEAVDASAVGLPIVHTTLPAEDLFKKPIAMTVPVVAADGGSDEVATYEACDAATQMSPKEVCLRSVLECPSQSGKPHDVSVDEDVLLAATQPYGANAMCFDEDSPTKSTWKESIPEAEAGIEGYSSRPDDTEIVPESDGPTQAYFCAQGVDYEAATQAYIVNHLCRDIEADEAGSMAAEIEATQLYLPLDEKDETDAHESNDNDLLVTATFADERDRRIVAEEAETVVPIQDLEKPELDPKRGRRILQSSDALSGKKSRQRGSSRRGKNVLGEVAAKRKSAVEESAIVRSSNDGDGSHSVGMAMQRRSKRSRDGTSLPRVAFRDVEQMGVGNDIHRTSVGNDIDQNAEDRIDQACLKEDGQVVTSLQSDCVDLFHHSWSEPQGVKSTFLVTKAPVVKRRPARKKKSLGDEEVITLPGDILGSLHVDGDLQEGAVAETVGIASRNALDRTRFSPRAASASSVSGECGEQAEGKESIITPAHGLRHPARVRHGRGRFSKATDVSLADASPLKNALMVPGSDPEASEGALPDPMPRSVICEESLNQANKTESVESNSNVECISHTELALLPGTENKRSRSSRGKPCAPGSEARAHEVVRKAISGTHSRINDCSPPHPAAPMHPSPGERHGKVANHGRNSREISFERDAISRTWTDGATVVEGVGSVSSFAVVASNFSSAPAGASVETRSRPAARRGRGKRAQSKRMATSTEANADDQFTVAAAVDLSPLSDAVVAQLVDADEQKKPDDGTEQVRRDLADNHSPAMSPAPRSAVRRQGRKDGRRGRQSRTIHTGDRSMNLSPADSATTVPTADSDVPCLASVSNTASDSGSASIDAKPRPAAKKGRGKRALSKGIAIPTTPNADRQPSVSSSPLAQRIESFESPEVQGKTPKRGGTPKLRRSIALEGADSDQPSTPGRALHHAKQKPKVIFTGYSDKAMEKIVLDLGGEMVEDICKATHLVTNAVKRTVKFLIALSRGIPIVGIGWLTSSKSANTFVSAAQFILRDPASEKLYKFSLAKSLEKAEQQPLLEGLSIHVTKNVKPDPKQMKEIIESAKGRFLLHAPASASPDTLVISCEEDGQEVSNFKALGLTVVSNEFLLTGILRQELDWDQFSLGGTIVDDGSSGHPTVPTTNRRVSKRGAQCGTATVLSSTKRKR